MILIQKVENCRIIRKIPDTFAGRSIYEQKMNDDHELIFVRHDVSDIGWLARIFGFDDLVNCYYVSPYHVSLIMESKIHLKNIMGLVRVTLKLDMQLDLEHSDSGKGLVDWLAAHGNCMYTAMLKSYVQDTLSAGVLEKRLGLADKLFSELIGLHYNQEACRDVLPHWLAATCDITDASPIITETEIMREAAARKRAEAEQRFQEELDEVERKKVLLEAKDEALELKMKIAEKEKELKKLKGENTSKEEVKGQLNLLKTAYGMLQPETDLETSECRGDGTPCPAKRLNLEIKGIRLELITKTFTLLGRDARQSDIIVKIPNGAMAEAVRKTLNASISGKHVELEYSGNTVRIRNLGRNSTYIRGRMLPDGWTALTGDADIGFGEDVHWRVRVQQCAGRQRLVCCNECPARKVSSLSLDYPGWISLYKVFVWQCCELDKVDSRLPAWRIVYQRPTKEAEGAFCLVTERGKCIYLASGQAFVESGIEIDVQ